MASISLVDDLDLSSVRLFVSAVELGSVSKAAARLRISQPSATAKLRKLERHLGVQLLERSPTGSRSTDAGTRVAGLCADLLSAGSALIDRADTIRAAGERLSIATTRHIADHFLPGWIAALGLPGTPLATLELDTLGVARAVRAGESVLGFVEGPHPPLGLSSTIVATEPVRPVVGRGHQWYGRRTTIPARELVDADLLLPRPGSGLRDMVESVLAPFELGASSGDHVDMPTTGAVRVAAIGGNGVGFLPQCWAREHVVRGDLHVLPVRDPEIELTVRAVWRGDAPATPPARALLDVACGPTLASPIG